MKNVLFLTLVEINSVKDRGIYQDLLRKFRDEGHQVTIVTPLQRRKKTDTNLKHKEGVDILQVKTLNITKTNVLEKSIGMLLLEYQYLSAIKRYLNNIKFDLILYSTPPITLVKVIEFIKKRDGAYSYLLLKDIFPQNAVDMKMLKAGSFLHRQFVKKEKKLYRISDSIGCMSPANVTFLLKYNPEIKPEKVEVNPNTIEPVVIHYSSNEKKQIREKYKIPLDKKILVYGGNLGKPQGIDFLLDTIRLNQNTAVHFLIVGDGTEFSKIQRWFNLSNPQNAQLFRQLPRKDYDKLLISCDIGLIFLHKDFLIPNFPARLLSYLEMKKPVIAATDPNTDVGDMIEEAGCGYKVLAGNIEMMNDTINRVIDDDLSMMGEKAWALLQKEYLAERSYRTIIQKLKRYV